MTDVGLDEPTRLELIGKCDINQHWSAAIGHVPGRGLRAFFCEIAYAQSALHADNDDWNDTGQPMPDTGIEVAPDWWRRPMADFAAQVATHCHHCGIPMRRPGQLAVDGKREEFSATHWHIARSKKRDRPIEFIAVDQLRSSARPATDYLPNITPRRPTP
jgi:hypothetical protein